MFISVALDWAAIFLTFRHLSEKKKKVTIPLGTQCVSAVALSIVSRPLSPVVASSFSISAVPEWIHKQPLLLVGEGAANPVLEQRFAISSSKSMYASQETPLICTNQALVVDPAHSTPDLFEMQ